MTCGKPTRVNGYLAQLEEQIKNACGVGQLKMSEYGIKEGELPKMVQNARENMAGPVELSNYQIA